MSDTPETDKNTWSDSSEGILYKVVTSDFARRLERERDEARNELKQWHTLRLYGAEPEYIHEYIRMLRYNC